MPRCEAARDCQQMKDKVCCQNAYHRVPGTCAERKSIIADTQAADTVVVTLQGTDSLTTEGIPDLAKISMSYWSSRTITAYLALKVIVTSEQKSSGNREGHGCDAADGLANLEE